MIRERCPLFSNSHLQNQVVADDKSPTAIPSDVQLFEAFSMQIANIVQVSSPLSV